MVVRAKNKVVTTASSASPAIPLLRLRGIGGYRSLTTRLDLIHNRLDLIHNLGQISSTIGQISSTTSDSSHPQPRLDLIHNRLDLVYNLGQISSTILARSHPKLGQISSTTGQISSTTSTRSHSQSVRSHPQPRLDLILYSAKSHPQKAKSDPQSVRFHPPPQLDLIHTLLHLIHTRLHLIHILGQISSPTSARSHPLLHSAPSNLQSVTSHPQPRLALIHNLGQISSSTWLHLVFTISQISSTIGQISSPTSARSHPQPRLHIIHNRLDLIHSGYRQHLVQYFLRIHLPREMYSK